MALTTITTEPRRRGRWSRLLPAGLVLALALFSATPAEATRVRLGLGANYWFVEEAVFDLTLGFTVPIVDRLSVGGRLGVGFVTGGNTVALPIDLVVRLGVSRFYFEGVAGPWVFFEGDNLAGHAAFGMGVVAGNWSFGGEIGYLEPRAILGAKIAYAF
jgi:hypothetical protein